MKWKTIAGCGFVVLGVLELPPLVGDAANGYGVGPLTADLLFILGGVLLVRSARLGAYT